MFGSLCIKASYARESILVIRTRVRRESEIARNCLVLQGTKTVFVTQLNLLETLNTCIVTTQGRSQRRGRGVGRTLPVTSPTAS